MDDYEDSPPSNSSSESSPKPSEKKNDSAQTALLPKSFFPENAVGVGKECKIRQVAIHEDEVEVRYMRHDSDKPKTESKPDNDDYA